MKMRIGMCARKTLMQTNAAQPCFLAGLLVALLFFRIAAETYPDDLAVLLALRQQWGNNNPQMSTWNGDDPCNSQNTWLGVFCDLNSRVETLSLPNMNLVGTLPIDIGNLKNLKRLDLSFNVNLTGTLPKELGNLVNLQSLVLQWCGFSGTIPSELGRLTSLTFLSLNGNYLSGPLPLEIGFLTELYWLDVSSNLLTGELPISSPSGPGLDNLIKAKHFHLNNNSFEGIVPGSIFHAEMALLHLLLDANKLNGPIPLELGLLKNITIIKLNNNNLSGKIPDTIANLTTLTALEANHNSFSETPPNLSTLKKLNVLDLSHNSFSAMDVPPWFSNLTSLNSLFMYDANLHGQIPSDVLALQQLRILKLSNNFINGSLEFPNNIGKQLEYIYLDYNNITDAISISLYNQSNELELQGNPVCKILSSHYCQMTLPPSSVFSESVCEIKTTGCPETLIINPTLCLCAVPYVGVYIFRAPQFRALDKQTDFSGLSSSIATSIGIDIKQVVMSNAYFDNFQYLNVWYQIFPSATEKHWTKEEVYKISYTLSSSDITEAPAYPSSIFGPPQFRPLPYLFPEEKDSMLSKSGEIGIIAAATALALIIIALCIYAILQRKRFKTQRIGTPFASWPGSSGAEAGGSLHLKGSRYFTFSELRKATDNFSVQNEIGTGGYGKVYRGALDSGDLVAIKRAHQHSLRGVGEFKTEIELLSRVHHKNLVALIGFCFDQGEQMLVYEYMANGTLQDNLFGLSGVGMDWGRRIMVALGAARGLAYLHEMANPPIIHRDIKSANILLDDKNVAKVADFGLGKVLHNSSHVSTQVKGTMGYLDPEYYMTNQLTDKSDVYGFGVVLLEILTATKPIQNGKYIVREVKTALDKGGIPALCPLLDPNLRDFPPDGLNRFLDLAIRCVEETGQSRPSMTDVVKELESLAGINRQSESPRRERVQHPYSPQSSSMQRENVDPSFQYSGGFMGPATIEPK